MAVTATKLKEERPQRTARGYATTELWEVADLDTVGGIPNQYTNAVIIDPIGGLSTPGLPQYGNSHIGPPALPGALVVDVAAVNVVSAFCVIYLVTYRSWGLYTGGPRSEVGAVADRRYQYIPIWRKSVVDGIIGWEEDKNAVFPRMTVVREESRSIPGNVVTAVVKAVAQNAGRLFSIDGDWYILSDRTRVRYDGLAYTRATFCFEIPCEFQGIGSGDPNYGNDQAVPYLPPLYQYLSYADLVSSANPPIIKVVPPPAINGNLNPFFP